MSTVLCPQPTPLQADPYSGWSQWITSDQATQLATYWNSISPNIYITPGIDRAPTDPAPKNGYGIYIPPTTEAYFPTGKTGPDGNVYWWLCLRFLDDTQNMLHGGQGGDMNAGLLMCQFARYPYSPQYVVDQQIQQVMSLPGYPPKS